MGICECKSNCQLKLPWHSALRVKTDALMKLSTTQHGYLAIPQKKIISHVEFSLIFLLFFYPFSRNESKSIETPHKSLYIKHPYLLKI